MIKSKLLKQVFSMLLVVSMLTTVFNFSVLAEETSGIDVTEEQASSVVADDVSDDITVEETPLIQEESEVEQSAPVQEITAEENASSDATQEPSKEPVMTLAADDVNINDMEYERVTNADELEATIQDGGLIRLEADFELDRTFYITSDTIICSDETRVLTRNADFGGDIFVVGEDSEGNVCESTVTLTLGNPETPTSDLLTIDGNKDNMTADVTGTVVFIANNACANFYELTIKNCNKTGNERTLDAKYALSYSNQIGGAAVIIASGTLDIYGGAYSNNSVHDVEGEDSAWGGAIYSNGALNIYASTIEKNYAARGGAIYNYGETHIYNADFIENSAAYRGGVVYMPSTATTKLFLGEENDVIEANVWFNSNTSVDRGGAIYAQGELIVNNSQFTYNTSTGGHGGAIAAAGKLDAIEKTLVVTNSQFEGNNAYYNGGAIYLTGVVASFTNVDFASNTATATANSSGTRYGGGAVYSTGSTSEFNTVTFTENNSDFVAGALALYSESVAKLNGVTATSNTAGGAGGAFYITGSQIEIADGQFIGNQATTNGGAIYFGASSADIKEGVFSNNTSGNNGGVIYSTATQIVIDGAEFTENAATGHGGAISMHRATDTQIASDIKMNNVVANGNTSENNGGFIYNNHSLLEVYNSEVNNSTAASFGGAVSLNGDAEACFYATSFKGNSSGSEGKNGYGGVCYINVNGKTTLFHSCTFEENTSNYFGGAIYIGQVASTLNLYNTTAKNNSAPKGAVVYQTKTGVVVTINGMTVSGNTVTDGGPLVWGNTVYCTLNINKNNFTDLDHTEALDDAYWANAIANNVTVYELEFDVPGYTDWGEEEGEGGDSDETAVVVAVTSAQQLEKAMSLGYTNFRVDADFEIDRTIYISKDTHIFSNEAHTLTRKASFAGDMFVIGEDANGNFAEETVTLTLGKEDAEENNLLVIDGNSENMTATVNGSALFVCKKGQADIYKDVTFRNLKKTANSRTLDEKYGLSYTDNEYRNYVGGAAIVSAHGTVNIYGSIFENNSANDPTEEGELTCTHGGAIYSFGPMNIYDGKFTGNHAGYGGAIYNYRETHIYNAEFTENSASERGGAVYMANSIYCKMYLGESLSGQVSKVVFDKNTSTSRGAAVYVQGVFNANNTEFTNNVSGGAGGAIASNGNESIVNDKTVTITNSLFENNESAGGGAVALYSKSTAYFGNVTFRNNASTSTGGAFVADDSNVKIYNSTFDTNTATSNGGAIMASNESDVYMSNMTFTGNSAGGNGGALYATASKYEIDRAQIKNNSATSYGGAISIHRATASGIASNAILNKITASENTAGKLGGFLYSNHSVFNMYNSDISKHTAGSHGGAITLQGVAETNIYATKFTENSCGTEGSTTNGGAMYVYTDDTITLLHSCTFDGNSAPNFGGGIYVSNGSQLEMYDTTAKNNTALKGGFMYETTTGTVVAISGLTVSGNTASSGGPIIWGNTTNATLKINKSNYTDLDYAGEYDDTYWAGAIVNKLTVEEITDEVPRYQDYNNELYDEYDEVFDVSTAAELEYAINSGIKNIRIVEDFEVDRTFYITGETVIFTTAKKTLTRKADFAGDIFVIGEDAQGNSSIELGKTAEVALGNQYSESSDLLIIDGNSENMTVDVTGSAIFLEESSQLDLYKNVTIQNNRKKGNSRILNEKYLLSTPNRVGGAGMIVSDGTVNIYGATFKNNICNEEITGEEATEADRDSSLGGAIYNRGTINVYSGLFEGNQAARGGVIYNIRAFKIYSGQFIGNHATTNGGAIYLAGSQFSQMYAGDQLNGAISDKILIKNNTSVNNGAGIYCASMAIAVIYGDTTFEGNRTESNGGAIATYGMVSTDNVVIKDNYAYGMGAGAYIANSTDDLVTRIVTFENTTFEGNVARNGGAIAVYASNAELSEGGIVEVKNCDFNKNKAVNTKDTEVTSNVFGGAVYITRKSTLNITDSDFTENEALFEGGAIYSAGESEITVSNSTFTKNKTADETDAKGGAVSIHSADIDFETVTFTENETVKNGGAVYVSYTTASAVNSNVNINNSAFNENNAGGSGGAIYVTKHKVETEEPEVLKVYNTTFNKNNASFGGATYFTSAADAYMKDVVFTNNTASSEKSNSYAGAIGLSNSSEVEIDGAEFTGNTSSYSAGAISVNSAARIVLNNAVASSNSVPVSAGFLYVNGGRADIYNSEIKENTAGANGGGAALYNYSIVNASNTIFDGNIAGGSGGAIYDTTSETETVLHSCTLKNNKATNYGGGIYAANKALLYMYNTTATANSANYGGFLYETVTGTEATINTLTVDDNTAIEAGPIIYGNSYGAVLNIHKINYTDLDDENTADESYWDKAIVNKLTVNDLSGVEDEIPECDAYVPRTEDEEDEKERVPVSVDDVLSLGLNSSDGTPSYSYGKLPKLDTSSNFMSRSTTVFPDINGQDVTVDTFVSHANDPANICTTGAGILLYQAILYKQAHPEEEVYIDAASFRFSSLAAVCINRDSRYFGYMRNLPDADYDKYGFVRLSYLLVTAAKMGVNVTVVGQLDGYPQPSSSPTLNEYFTYYLDEPCDPAYAEGKFVRDYMNFGYCEWTSYDNKAATDMMHTKMVAVSHYLDMNGNVQRNAVWSSSSNIDGVNSNATNGNNKMQTATIVSNHEGIFRATHNYINIIPEYCGQEEVYQFRTLVADMSKNQIDLIEAGRENEIDPDKQIVYLGSETDDVFELYFAPFGGDVVTWTESYNPYCKYVRKFSNSDDYVTMIWNSANYDKTTPIVLQMEEMLTNTFLTKKNPNNKIYTNLEDFDSAPYSDLVMGQDIGLKSFNKYEFGALHSKDLQLSYSENGKREYVSILSSINMHGGAMSYQSNYVLVIKEDDCNEGSVFFNVADQTSTGVVEHGYTDIKTFLPEDPSTHGYTYKECEHCGKTEILDTVHRPGEWTVAKEATATVNGISYQECKDCGEVISAKEVVGKESDITYSEGVKFKKDTSTRIKADVSAMPHTFEAVIQLPTTHKTRAGVVVSNYEITRTDLVCVEIIANGKPRLYYRNNLQIQDCTFKTDVRSNSPKHIAITVDGNIATLYVGGKFAESKVLTVDYPSEYSNMYVGGDDRAGNLQYFRGTIYSATMFGDVRTADEIRTDAVVVPETGDNLLYSQKFPTEVVEAPIVEENTIIHPVAVPFDATLSYSTGSLKTTPHTFEAVICVPRSYNDRAGVVVSNYNGGTDPQISIEIYSNGRPRLYAYTGSARIDCVFTTDVRSDIPRHMAIAVDGKTATLYLDGEVVETKTIKYNLPETTDGFKIGGDDRSENAQYFKGTIRSVALFGDVRSAEEIKKDAVLVTQNEEDLVYLGYFTERNSKYIIMPLQGNSFTKDNPKDFYYDTTKVPHTFDAVIQLPENVEERGGVIVGNYKNIEKNVVSLEIYTGGKVRLYYENNNVVEDCVFDTDVRGDKPVGITVTVKDGMATLYIDGDKKEEKVLTVDYPEKAGNLKIGGDNRSGNTMYFKGKIYSVSLYEEALGDEEIKNGALYSSDKAFYSSLLTTQKQVSVSGTGREFTSKASSLVSIDIDKTPYTFEAMLNVPEDVEGRAGVIVGNYALNVTKLLSFEIYSGGRPRIYGKTGGKNEVIDCIFDTDIRGNKPVHVAITVDGLCATLYINGQMAETKTLKYALPNAIESLKIGGDNRSGNGQYFKGTIYSVALFSDVRSADEIALDVEGVPANADAVLYNTDFTGEICADSPTGGTHIESDWIIDREATEGQSGLKHTECITCGIVLITKEYAATQGGGISVDFTTSGAGKTFALADDVVSVGELSSTPKTFEAIFNLPKSYTSRAGTIVGNYDGVSNQQINVEIYNNGKPRLYYKNGSKAYTYLFTTDVRSDSITHLAITVDGNIANLYINGELKETATLSGTFSTATANFKIGADNRTSGIQYFKGTLYGVNLFSDVRDAEEIKLDRYLVTSGADNLIYSKYFVE